MYEKFDPKRNAQVEPQGNAAASEEAYWCVICGRCIEPEEHDGENYYVHDDKPHPVTMNFDEMENPQ